jgi:cell division septum initiation protein DivIVA
MTMNTRSTASGDLQVVHGQGGNEPAEALGLLGSARRVAEETMARARTEAEQMIAAARQDVAMLEKEARAHADEQLATAGREAERVRYQAYGEAERMLNDARAQVAELERTAARLRSERAAAADSARELATKLLQATDGSTGPVPGEGA